MSVGLGQILLILVIVFVIFGAGKLPNVMADLGKGIKSFKQGMNEEEEKDSSSRTKSLQDHSSSTNSS